MFQFHIPRYSAPIACALLVITATAAQADHVTITSLKDGYTYQSIELGVPFGGSLAQHPSRANILYASYGNFAEHQVLELDTDTNTTRTVTPLVGNIGGLAVLNNGDLAITENFDVGLDTILLARDGDSDGAFLAPGEISELIEPILHDGNFSGAQLAVAPAGNASAIPAGSLVVQTADGGTSSELLVVQNPESAPAYRPAGGAYYSGYNYNGGLAFTAEGHIVCGISDFPVGRVVALVNTNADEDIDAGESNEIVGAAQLPSSLSDLSVSSDGKLVTSENGGTIRLFNLPANLLTGTATPDILATTNATYVSSVRLDFPSRPFSGAPAGPKGTVYLGGYVTFPAATNLVAITPIDDASVAGWEMYD